MTLGISLAPSGTEDSFYLYLALLVVIPLTILTISTFLRMAVDRKGTEYQGKQQ